MIRMDMPFYGPGGSTMVVDPEFSMDGTKWEPSALGTQFGPYSVGDTAFGQKTFAASELKRYMRWKIQFNLGGAGSAAATFDLTGIGRSGV